MSTNPAAEPSTIQEMAPDVHSHPGWRTYVVIGAILTAITAVEVAVFYIPAMHPYMAPVLITLSAAKFLLVVMFYMHLKFDSRWFTSVFAAPLFLAVTVGISLVILFRVLPFYNLH
jgi:cytochrome c oxidase subunit 4